MNISVPLQQHQTLLQQSWLGPKERERKKENWRLHTLLMLHHQIHIGVHRWNGSWVGKIR